MTPSERTLKALRDRGCVVGRVEQFNPFSGHREDLFGFLDYVALDVPAQEIVGVQSTGTAFAAHRRKIVEDRKDQAIAWLTCGGKIELWGWRKLKVKHGGRQVAYRPRVERIELEDLL